MHRLITREEFIHEIKKWSEELNVEPNTIQMREMKRKVASCSSKGRITFDKSILNMQKKERDEIIVHELLHLRYPSHGKMFKTVLNSYINKKN